MKLWINVENSCAGDNAAIIAFAAAARQIGLSVFFDPNLPLICIANGADAFGMERKAERGIVSNTPPCQNKIGLEGVA